MLVAVATTRPVGALVRLDIGVTRHVLAPVENLVRLLHIPADHPLLVAVLVDPNVATGGVAGGASMADEVPLRVTSGASVLAIALREVAETEAGALPTRRPSPYLASDPPDQTCVLPDAETEAVGDGAETVAPLGGDAVPLPLVLRLRGALEVELGVDTRSGPTTETGLLLHADGPAVLADAAAVAGGAPHGDVSHRPVSDGDTPLLPSARSLVLVTSAQPGVLA